MTAPEKPELDRMEVRTYVREHAQCLESSPR
jgi:hypothetical protein